MTDHSQPINEIPTSPSVDGETQQYVLRAMANNYGDGPHCWDRLDKEVCAKAADEIKALRAALSRSGAPVAWRWKPKGAQLWIYNPEAGWLADQDKSTIDVEPLYAAPSPALDPATVEACAKVAEQTPMPSYGTNARFLGREEATRKIAKAIRALTGKDGA